MNNEVSEKNKKNNGMIFIIVLLILLVIGLAGFIVYDKVLTKEKQTKQKEVTKELKTEEVSENLDNVAELLINKLDKYFVDYYDYQEKVDFTALDDSELIKAALAYEDDMNLTKSKVDEYFNNLFGKKLTTYPDYNCWADDGVIYKYNYDKGEYEEQEGHGHGGLCISHSAFINYNNIEKNNDKYTITVTKVYGPTQGICRETPENAFYADSKYTVKIDGLNNFTRTDSYGNWDTANADLTGAKYYYEQHYDEFKNIKPQYKYTFKKDITNNNYYLVSYELVK